MHSNFLLNIELQQPESNNSIRGTYTARTSTVLVAVPGSTDRDSNRMKSQIPRRQNPIWVVHLVNW